MAEPIDTCTREATTPPIQAAESRSAPSAPSLTSGEAERRAAEHDRWRRLNRDYYAELSRLFARHVPLNARVLQIGCGTGDLLAELQPAFGVGIDDDPCLIETARRRHPGITFLAGAIDTLEPRKIPGAGSFDAIVICDRVGQMRDVQAVFAAIRPLCKPRTRVIVSYHNALWEPVLNLASRWGLRRRFTQENWLSRDDLANLFELTGFQVVRQFCEILMPKHVPLVSPFLNRFAVKFWPFKHLALTILLVARPVMPALDRREATVSVIVPTRNERGNVDAVVARTPEMGGGTEIVFVDGWSTDGTQAEIERCIGEYPDRRIRLIAQLGPRGKGQAVRQGFAAATGDVLMILDADLTVAPEDLPRFFDALADGRGEFINGTRLVYPMDRRAMRFLNKCGNRFFSLLFTWLIGQRFRDTLCGTKVLTREDHERIAGTRAEIGLLDPFGDFDLIFGAARHDLKIIEIPVRYGARAYGATNIRRFRDGWLLLQMSWEAFWKLRLR